MVSFFGCLGFCWVVFAFLVVLVFVFRFRLAGYGLWFVLSIFEFSFLAFLVYSFFSLFRFFVVLVLV